MKKSLLITKEIFELNKDNIKVMELFASGKLEVGKSVESNVHTDDAPITCCETTCPKNPSNGHYECVFCNCILVPNP